jgi:hypothetical protein
VGTSSQRSQAHLPEIKNEHLLEDRSAQARGKPLQKYTSEIPAYQRNTTAPGRALQFQPGERVRHPNFGEGEVVSSRPIEGDEEVIVIFDEQGQKKLLATFAQLQRVGE